MVYKIYLTNIARLGVFHHVEVKTGGVKLRFFHHVEVKWTSLISRPCCRLVTQEARPPVTVSLQTILVMMKKRRQKPDDVTLQGVHGRGERREMF